MVIIDSFDSEASPDKNEGGTEGTFLNFYTSLFVVYVAIRK